MGLEPSGDGDIMDIQLGNFVHLGKVVEARDSKYETNLISRGQMVNHVYFSARNIWLFIDKYR
jgi:hypothetical protein